MKKILYFFPINPLEKNEGNKTRALNLLRYFQYKNFDVDFVSLQNFGSTWKEEDISTMSSLGLARRVFILTRKPERKNLYTYLFKHKLPDLIFQKSINTPKNSIPNPTTFYLRDSFERILQENQYDFIIISYIYWADLISNSKYLKASVSIIDTHDFMTSQHQKDYNFNIGAAFAEELRRLGLFHQIWTVSSDEQYFFSQFFSGKVRYIPVMVSKPEIQEQEREFDLIYVASQNPHNILSAKWFFEQVYPLLPLNLNICIVGQVVNYIGDYQNVFKVTFAEDLGEYYRKSKVAICPMLSGTGVKVKVIEAFSYTLPVVCTLRGVDGIPDKRNNGCLATDDPSEFKDHIIALLSNKKLYRKISANGIRTFNDYFTSKQCYKMLDKALDR